MPRQYQPTLSQGTWHPSVELLGLVACKGDWPYCHQQSPPNYGTLSWGSSALLVCACLTLAGMLLYCSCVLV